MDVWGCFILFYGIIISFLRVRSQQPPGYIGCFRMGTFGKITVRSIQVYNNGTYCIGFCKFSKHRFAGTQGHMCLCGNTILVDAKLPYCEYECPGHIAEFCGGVKKMSVYEIQRYPKELVHPNIPFVYRREGYWDEEKNKEDVTLAMEAQESYGYIGCFKDDIFRKTIWSPKVDSNNGAQCIRTCISSGYIYAATQSHYCKCGMSIRGNPKQVSCGYRCPGYQYEICGGRDSMSVFDIRLITKTEKSVTQSTPSTTQIIALITSTETESTKQADYNREMATQTQSRTEIRRAEMRITTDKAPANNSNKVSSKRGETTDVHVYVFISIPFVIVVMFAVTVAIIYYRRRKRRMQENEQSDRPNSTEANSNYYLTAVHADNYTYTSVQDTLLHPSVANADSKDVNDLLHSMPLASTVQNEYVDISYEELVSQRKDEHYYSQPNKNLHRSPNTTQLKV